MITYSVHTVFDACWYTHLQVFLGGISWEFFSIHFCTAFVTCPVRVAIAVLIGPGVDTCSVLSIRTICSLSGRALMKIRWQDPIFVLTVTTFACVNITLFLTPTPDRQHTERTPSYFEYISLFERDWFNSRVYLFVSIRLLDRCWTFHSSSLHLSLFASLELSYDWSLLFISNHSHIALVENSKSESVGWGSKILRETKCVVRHKSDSPAFVGLFSDYVSVRRTNKSISNCAKLSLVGFKLNFHCALSLLGKA